MLLYYLQPQDAYRNQGNNPGGQPPGGNGPDSNGPDPNNPGQGGGNGNGNGQGGNMASFNPSISASNFTLTMHNATKLPDILTF